MHVILESIAIESERGSVMLAVRVGDEPAKKYLVQHDDPNSLIIEHELFMHLSDLAATRYCNCLIYQVELIGIIKAFLSSERLPPFPVELGTTSFGIARPTSTKIYFNRLRRPFISVWLWWKFRHIRRSNILKYAKTPNKLK